MREAEAEGRPFALAFVDVRMPPGWDGVETINRIWQRHPDLQVVICTAYSDYSWEEMIRRIGKSDSLVILKKPFDNIEVLQLAHALTEKWHLSHEVKGRLKNLDLLVSERTTALQSANEKLKKEIAERMLLENALRLSEERFSKAFKASPIPLAIQSLQAEKFVDANLGFQQLTGYSREELVGQTSRDLRIWDDPGGGTAMLRSLREQMSVRNMPCRLRTKAKELRHVLLSVELFELGEEPFMLIIAQDMTEQLELEDQLRQAQKMEAVGQLAAGVAHDFNNILTVVQGHVDLVLEGQPSDSKDRGYLQSVLAAADRAAKLIRQLLAFSRKQAVQMRPMTIGESLSALADMLPRVLGDDIHLDIRTPLCDLQINADRVMMDQMLMNLAVNARDAMPDGGLLSIKAEVVKLDPTQARLNREARPGQFLRLSVTDTGCGIAPEVLPRISSLSLPPSPSAKGRAWAWPRFTGSPSNTAAGWTSRASLVRAPPSISSFQPCNGASARTRHPDQKA